MASISRRHHVARQFVRRMLSGAALSALSCGMAMAQPAASADGVTTEEIVVTAQKREQALNDVPMSITALTGQALAARGVVDTAGLANTVPGFTYTESRVGTPIYTLRGVGFNDIALGGRPTVTVYRDQAPVPFTIETRGGFMDLERVEVLVGPQGTLFGQNSTGGAVNLVAAKPTATPQAKLEAGAGSDSAYTVDAFAAGPLSDTLRGRIAIRHDQSGGWQRSLTTGKANGAKDLTEGRGILEWRPTAAFTASLTLYGFVDRSDNQSPAIFKIQPSDPTVVGLIPGLATTPLAPRDDRATDFNPNESYARDNRYVQADLRMDYVLPHRLTLTSLTSYSHYDENQNQDLDGSTLSGLQQRTYGSIASFSQEVRLAGQVANQVYVTAGASYASDKTRERNVDDISQSTQAYAFVGYGIAPFWDFGLRNDQDIKTYAAFGNLEYSPIEALTLQLGLRYTKSENSFRGCTSDLGNGTTAAVFSDFHNLVRTAFLGLPALPPIAAGGCITADALQVPTLITSKLDEDNVSWRIGANYDLTRGVMVYANVSRGYKAGGFPTLAATATAQYDPTKQESVTAYEAGIKASLSRDLQVNGAVYQYDYRDKQVLGIVADPSFGRLLRLLNIPASRVRGVELQVSWTPIAGLTASGNASYVKTEITRDFIGFDANGVSQNFRGQPFPNSPRWQLSADVAYERPVAEGLKAFAGVNVSYRSSTNSELGEIPDLLVDGYALVNLRAGLEAADGRWRVAAWVKNVGDTYYYTSATRSIDVFNRMAGMPRTYGVTVSRRFGG
ncbi:MAG: TonB-dependent receptor, partial [Proteobacteria bacterium]|nr:TonB-dependent receptor [Pseudomonadota bacterium]